MAKTAIQQRLGAITLPPTPKTGRSLKEVELATATWTKQAQQSLKRIAEVLGTLTTGQIPEGGTEVIGNVPTPPGVFFTNERARAAVSATSPVLYDQPTGVFSIQLAKADGAFLGAAAFVAADFDDNGSGVISLDYVNGQKASGSVNGFLSSTDWTTFNNKVSTTRAINTTSPLLGGGDLSADRTLSIQFAKADASTVGAATFAANDFDDNGSGLLSIDYTNGQKASGSVPGFLTAADWTTFNNKLSTSRLINTTSPLLGGGDLTADRTLSIQDAAADGTTKGAAAFTAADFNAASGVISLDYTNGQKATGSVPGFLSSTDWTTFNNKVSTTRAINTTSPLSGGGDLSADRTLTIADAKADASTKGAATFATNDFNDDGAGKISIDYANGQVASASQPGFLSSTDWSTFNTAAAGNLTIITSNTTYYVRTDGNDSNSGTANTSGGAWLTIQKAINFVMQRLVIQKGVVVTIQIGDGTYTESPTCSYFLGGGLVTIQGNTTTPANVVVSTGSGGFNIVSSGWTLTAFKITGTGNGVDCRSGATVTLTGGLNIGTTGTAQIQAIYGGAVLVTGALTFSASASFGLFATRSGTIQMNSGITVTMSGTPAYTIFAFGDINGTIYAPGVTFSGSATGQRYSALLTGAIFTNAGGANYFPGNVAGSTASGGQYA